MGQNRYLSVWLASSFCLWLSGCIHVVIGTTLPPTTTRPTTIPPHGCLYEGQFYPDGAIIEEDEEYKCHGAICEGNSVTYWDHKCSPALGIFTCPGKSERIKGQCCPICESTTTPPTTTPRTTTILPPTTCLYNGTVYANYDTFNFSPDGCTGYECHYGVVRPLNRRCTPLNNCNGTVTVPEGQCCGICVPPGGGCYIRGEIYKIDDVTDTDPCNYCHCTGSGEEVCRQPQCDITDCAQPYRPEGQCCFTCGSSILLASLSLIVTILAMLRLV